MIFTIGWKKVLIITNIGLKLVLNEEKAESLDSAFLYLE